VSARRATLWALWALLSLALAAAIGAGFVLDAQAMASPRWSLRQLLLPGATSHGHHQIELKCESCHGGESFAGPQALQQACMRCHGAELKEARDSHPRSKFTDPRHAERAARLDAARCATCHVEHQPRLTHAAGVTLPQDFCVICHDDIAKDRPSHAGLAFTSCASAGCHNFHDNRALYEDFLLKHAGQPALLPQPRTPPRDFARVAEEIASYPSERFPLKPLSAHDGGAHARTNIAADWLASAHARGGVNCSACHVGDGAGAAAWLDKPSTAQCATCHTDEAKTFAGGKHGMRAAAGLSAMQPRLAHAAMKADAATRELSCTSCHGAHRFDTHRAAAQACLGCHDDGHSRAWEASPHAAQWRRERAGELPPGSGVSCATCHLPRVEHRSDDVKRILVQHNQNDTLRPNDKMLRSACLACHGLQFSLDALADRALIERNFAGRPSARIPSIEMAQQAERRADESRRKAREGGS
jgi:predicted CXXCH cytochrome family protein